MIIKKLCLLLSCVFIISVTSAGCEEEVIAPPLWMMWGIDERVSGFQDLQREPEGLEVESVDADLLRVSWEAGDSYILPISAVADEELEGVRYLGTGIPDTLLIEWLDPRERQWYVLNDIPAEMVEVNIVEENGYRTLDFGPPGGARFEEDMFRVIWFRITPLEVGRFGFDIYGYLSDQEEEVPMEPISNILTLEAEILPEPLRNNDQR